MCGLLTSCDVAGTDEQRSDVAANGLGVTSIAVARHEEPGVNVFEVRGLSANEQELARVRLRIGALAEVRDAFPEADVGSELVFSAFAHEQRFVTRETGSFSPVLSGDPQIESFVRLPEVRIALASAKIAWPDESDEDAYSTTSCNSGQLLVSPLAKQCCFGGISLNATVFVRPDGKVVQRNQNPTGPGTGCRASNGTGSCSGTACFYGPNGFSKPVFNSPPVGSPYAKIYTNTMFQPHCDWGWWSSPQTPEFLDATGTSGLACGCACDNSGRTCYDGTQPGTCGSAASCTTMGCPTGSSGGGGTWNY